LEFGSFGYDEMDYLTGKTKRGINESSLLTISLSIKCQKVSVKEKAKSTAAANS